LISVEKIRELYASYNDNKIIDIAKNSKGLRSEAIEFLNHEIKKRNLDVRFIKRVAFENYLFTEIEKQELILKLKKLICPYCQLNTNLSGVEFVNTGKANKVSVACEECFKDINVKSILSNFIQSLLPPKDLLFFPFSLISIVWNQLNYGNFDVKFFNQLFEERNAFLAQNKGNSNRLQVLINKYKYEY
jgi:hypothetical protein